MTIIALDPGPTETGYVILADGRVQESGTLPNQDVLWTVVSLWPGPWGVADARLAIEMVASYGMAVGRDVFETVRWIGRFQQAWHAPDDVLLVYRQDVKLHLCKSARAKDANIRQALIDLLGAPGTKKAPGPTYGVKGHEWAALAVAVTAAARLHQAAA